MEEEIHQRVVDKINELPITERELALRALELSFRTNSSTVAEKLFSEINEIMDKEE
ncbi:hypothetical protein [Acetohalobium arabaticum]|uniref:Uncharacterized protein n=1 Tax=Acetohalobium arabaticum (strain ATCC 49924 / DSM 5501 / Z-7288) TaxID=574087 RepID=D9QVD0_ACEAZ|nr:hypothetical protein [Acetohalobium arabaticum]ADL12189.1 hypothetical protein Acear_0648 [Acetohalobium arabaticum DSM 5501]